MRWMKKGLIFKPEGDCDWMVSHASIPVANKISDDLLRIYFGARDAQGRSFPGYIEVRASDPRNILYVHNQPILQLGEQGTFDDNGIMPSWVVDLENEKYLYYIGWNQKVKVPYHLSIGLATSRDGGKVFKRYSEGPILDRDVDEPYFNTAPCVLAEKNIWKMWYVSCTGWKIISNRPEPYYHVKYAESSDGIHWRRSGRSCIYYDNFADAFGRPCVFKEEGIYKMFYSYRSSNDYRTDPKQSYRLGYAESEDGINWTRKDDEVGIHRSDNEWDSEMMEYCYIYEHENKKYMLYNGNGFGESGFGYAVLDET